MCMEHFLSKAPTLGDGKGSQAAVEALPQGSQTRTGTLLDMGRKEPDQTWFWLYFHQLTPGVNICPGPNHISLSTELRNLVTLPHPKPNPLPLIGPHSQGPLLLISSSYG